MATDSIVAEVRAAREKLAERFNYDLRAMIEDAKARQAAGTRKTVSFPAKPVGRSANPASSGPSGRTC
jgi:hypothetical protein